MNSTRNRTLTTLFIIGIVLSIALLITYIPREESLGTPMLNGTKLQDTKIEHAIKNFKSISSGKDKTPPLIVSNEHLTLKKGAAKIPNPLICIDDFDKSVECKIEGEYDLNKSGKYKLKRVAIDSAGNRAEKDLILNVVDEIAKYEPKDPVPLNFATAVKNYKNKDTSVGIDVSKWQGKIDFEKVADSSAEFVMIRIGVQDGFAGKPLLDKFFLQNYINAKAAGLKVGVYFYSYATTLEEAAEQAYFVTETLRGNGMDLDLPVVFDWESWEKLSTLNMSLNDLNDCAKIFLEIVEKEGYEGALYGSKFYLKNNLWLLDDYDMWLAHYANQTDYEGKYFMWQCSANGRIPGIQGDVDINILYK